MLGLALLLALGAHANPSDEEARERLEALIASTNDLEHFHAEYVSTREGKEGHLTLDYRAPGDARIRGVSTKGVMDLGSAGSAYWMSHERPDSSKVWGLVDMTDRGGAFEAAMTCLRGEYWNEEGVPQVSVGIDWQLDENANRLEPFLSLESKFVGRGDHHFALLGWLHRLLHVSEPLSIEGTALVYRGEGVLCRVDLETGLLNELRLSTEDSEHFAMTIKSADLSTPPSDDEFACPEPDPEAEDVSEQFRAKMLSTKNLRRFALLHVHSLLQRENRRLGGESSEELRTFLTALVEPMTVRSFADLLDKARSNSQQFADWVRSSLAAGRPRGEIDQAIGERRKANEAQIERGRGLYLDQFGEIEDDGDDDWRAILVLERDVLEASYHAVLGGPVLEHFDASVADALGE